MKIGMNLLLWTGHVGEEHVLVLRALKATGFFIGEEQIYAEGHDLIRKCCTRREA